jgi:F-type H+-transporting ATPase subunit epsilon
MAIALEIVSPEKLLISKPVDMVVIPAAEGDLGVLPEHAPMIVMLRGGTITVHQAGQVTDRLYIVGGFAEITPERCTVLANEAIPVAEVSRKEGERRLAEAEADYNAADKNDIESLDAAMDRMQAARAMVETAQAT